MEGEQVEIAQYNEEHEATTKHLTQLMQEYLTLKKLTRESILSELHPNVQKRIYALKKIQLESIDIEAEFHRAVYDLEQKFMPKQNEVATKRLKIVTGVYEPTDEDWIVDGEGIKFNEPSEGQENPSGIPEFWLTVLKNVHELSGMIQSYDEPILSHLTDIRATSKLSPDLSFELEFHFEPNEFFTNSILTKTYLMKCTPDPEEPYMFEGPEIYKSIGCEISWNEGKNVFEKATSSDPSTPFFKGASFFNFFNPPEMTRDDAGNELIENFLENDFEVGHYLKERVIPRAVLFFTNEIEEDLSDTESLELASENFSKDNESEIVETTEK